MGISYYAPFFHDGGILDIRHIENNIDLTMTSAEMDQEDLVDDMVLSNDDYLRGKLHIEGVKNITIDEQPFQGKLTKNYDSAGIFDFEVTENTVLLMIIWKNFPRKPEEEEFSVINIEADKVWWENIPTLQRPY